MKGLLFAFLISLAFGKQIVLDLGGSWQLKSSSGNISTTGFVPGEVHGDLIRNGLINDPYYRDNDSKLRWIVFEDWTYSRKFSLSQQDILYPLHLICHGIDTVSTIYIDGQAIGTTDNQFRRYIFPLSISSPGEHTIDVVIKSAGKYVEEKMKNYPYPLAEATSQEHSHGELGRSFIRKESCSFAWDWGPCFMPQGIWKPIEIAGSNTPILVDLMPQVFNEKSGQFKIKVSANFISSQSMTNTGSLTIKVAGFTFSTPFTLSSQSEFYSFSHEIYVPSSSVSLWWPIGYGSQFLYDISAFFDFSNGDQQSETKRIGFRSFELVQEKYTDREGRSFYFRVNGIPIWSKGSNAIPLDSFESRVTRGQIKNLLQSAVDTNMNTMRVWGGGVYQDEYFYELCDEMGLLVWQEFMFACALYPSNKEFLDTVKEEVKYQVSRLIHHVSLVLWSGNNENQQAITEGWFEISNNNPWAYAIDYERLYHDTIRNTLLEVDQSRVFISSSPANGVVSESPYTERWRSELGGTSNDQRFGDNHYYNYKDDCEDVYSMVSPRFSSEFGFQSMPSLEAIKRVSEPSDWYWDSPFLKYRNHRTGDGQVEIMQQMTFHFKFPSHPSKETELERFIYLSQVTQGICYKAQSEHYRRSKTQGPNTMGALYWQLNDIWEAPTWSSIEYGGKWKQVLYFVKNFFSPFLVSSYRQKNDIYDIHVTSDITSELSGNVVLEVWNWTNQRQSSISIPFELNSLGSKSILQRSFNDLCNGNQLNCLFVLSAKASTPEGRTFESKNFFFPTKPKNIEKLPAPEISLGSFTQTGDEIQFVIASKQIALFLVVDTELKGRFSDNSIVLLPNNPVTFTFYCWETVNLEQFKSSLKITSLYDALPQ